MSHDLEVAQSINIHTSAENVWAALTDPAIIKEYLFRIQTITDWKPGREIIFQGEYKGQAYKDILYKNISYKKLSYTYWSSFLGIADIPENYSLITYIVESGENGQTLFTWSQKGYANAEGYEHSKTGMDDFLKQIKAIIER